MDLNRVHAFVQVVEKGSFTAAAQSLGLPKSSVSRSVSRLEQDLGVTLLRRTTRTSTLTDAGVAYYERARAAVQQLVEAADAASDAGDEPRGVVRLTAPIDVSGRMLTEPLVRFVREHPRIHLDLVLTARQVDLVAEGIDLAVRAGRLADSTLIARRIGATPVALFASPEYLARRGRPKKLADLARHDCVLFRGNGMRSRWTLDGPRGEESVEVQGPISADEMQFVVNATDLGAGVAMLPVGLAQASLDAGRIVRVLPELSQRGGSIYVVHPSMKHLPRRVALLRDFLLAELKARFDS